MKKVKLTEKQLKNAVNEISHRKVQLSSDRSYDLFSDLIDSFSDFYDDLKYFYREGMQGEWLADIADNNSYIGEIRKYADKINAILIKKEKQKEYFDDNLNNFDYKSYWDSEEGQNEDYDDKDLRYLQNKYPRNNV